MQTTIAHLSNAILNERIDSQFFWPEYVKSYEVVSEGTYSALSDIAHITDGNHLKIAENFDNENGIRYLRGQDLSTDMMLNDRNLVHIPESCFNTLKRSHIFKDDILITIVGANTGLVGLVFDPPNKLVANCKLGIARPNKKKVLPGFLYAFLVGRYGQHQILRSIRGGGQTGLILPDMRGLRIGRFDDAFESNINEIIIAGHKGIAASKELFLKTQNTLLTELDLKKWQPKHQLTFIKNHTDSVQAGRLDAEYFQPKYETIIKAIKAYKGGWETLGDIVTVKKSVEVGSGAYIDEGIPFIRVSNLSPLEITEEKYISEKLYAEIKQHQPRQGEILFSKDGSPGIAHYLDTAPRKMIPSGGMLRLKSKTSKINNEYLTLVLNSVLVKEQINRDVGGSIILHWRPDQVKETVIPILTEEKQNEIQTKVIESLGLRKQSKHLLECAKRAVEIALEQGEQTAISWLKNETKEIKI